MAKTGDARKPPRTEVQADEARQSLGDLIDRVGFRGERIVVTRHGKQLIALVSIADLEKLEKDAA